MTTLRDIKKILDLLLMTQRASREVVDTLPFADQILQAFKEWLREVELPKCPVVMEEGLPPEIVIFREYTINQWNNTQEIIVLAIQEAIKEMGSETARA